MPTTAQLRLNVPVDQARQAVATALAEQGFTVQPTPVGTLDVSRGSLGTTLVAGAFAGQDMHVQFTVRVSESPAGAVADFEHSSVGGFFKGGAIGASKAADVVREAAHQAGHRLGQQGLIEGGAPAVPAPDAPGPAPAAAAPAATPPPAAPGAPYGALPTAAPPIDYSNRTNVVSIVALVLGFVVPLGGIIAGAVGLAQVKRTGEKGRGLAIAGIVIGSVMIVLTIAAVIVIFALSAIFATQQAEEYADIPPYSSEVPDDSFGDDSGTDAGIEPLALQVGECLDEVASGLVSEENIVDCAGPHTYEVYSDFALPGDTFPGTDEVDLAADDGCYAAFPGFVGISYEESTLDFVYLAPDEQLWASGDRQVACLLVDPAGEVTGSLAGSAR